MEKHELFNISGPYGVGKDTMLNNILAEYGDSLHRVGTVTTRPATAQSDPSYRSATNEEFAEITSNGTWIINRQLDGKLAYATSIDEIEREAADGKVCVHSIFPGEHGAAQLRREFGSRLCSVALLPAEGEEEAQMNELRKRMVERGREPLERIEEKLSAQRGQIHFILENQLVDTPDGQLTVFDTVIINDNLDEALKEVTGYFAKQFPQLKHE